MSPGPIPGPEYSPCPSWSLGALLFCYIGPMVAVILSVIWFASL